MHAGPVPNRLLLGSIAVLTITGTAGAAFAPALLTYSPLLLLALSPITRHLVLAAPITDVVPFVAIATARRVLSCGVAYWVGLSYGELGLKWVEGRYPRFRRFVHWLEHAFHKVGPLLLVVAPSPPMCALAGTLRLSKWHVLPAALIGQLVWVGLAYWLGDFLSAWTGPILVWLREHVVEATAACIALFGGYQVIKRMRRKRSAESILDSLPKA
jgi:membrane protein DedA with SNARE-associated domain